MDVLLRGLWEWQGLVQREEQARSPTKSEGDSAVLEGLVRGDGLLWQSLRLDGKKNLQHKNGWHIASRKQ